MVLSLIKKLLVLKARNLISLHRQLILDVNCDYYYYQATITSIAAF